jgi:hypothetical protein
MRRRISIVPRAELLSPSGVVSRTRFGGCEELFEWSSRKPATLLSLRLTGLERFSGPGAPRRWPAPALVPSVSA